MHILVETWFPFSVDVCLDGPPMAARQMDGAGIGDQHLDSWTNASSGSRIARQPKGCLIKWLAASGRSPKSVLYFKIPSKTTSSSMKPKEL
jgi:hypothetical protein